MNAITESFRRALVALANLPTHAAGLAVQLEVSITTARRHLRDGMAGGYIQLINETYSLTDKGQKAIIEAHCIKPTTQVNAYSRAIPTRSGPMSFPVWTPAHYDHNIMRPGSMDAHKLPSMTAGGRVWPRGLT